LDEHIGYVFYEKWIIIGLIVVTVVSLFVFFTPLLATHKMMTREMERARVELGQLAQTIHDSEKLLLAKCGELDDEKLRSEMKKIDDLRAAYARCSQIPTWPVDVKTWKKFFLQQAVLWLGILGSISSLLN
jgi:hypothetical protein